MVAHACHPSNGEKHKVMGIASSRAWAKSEGDPMSKITRAKRAGGVAQGDECLLCKPEAKFKLLTKPQTFWITEEVI
jgi:hypothetical protein